MGEIGARLVERGEAVELGGRGMAEPAQLREDEPHPVAALAPRSQFAEGGFVDGRLRRHEAVEVEGVAGHCEMPMLVPQNRRRAMQFRRFEAYSSARK